MALEVGKRYVLHHRRKGDVRGVFFGEQPADEGDEAEGPDAALWLFDLELPSPKPGGAPVVGERLVRPSLVDAIQEVNADG
jgi:hypothetical protein